MRKITTFTLGLLGMTFVGITALVYQFWVTTAIEPPRAPQGDTAEEQWSEITHVDQTWQSLQGNIDEKSILIDYNILPDIEQTAHTKNYLTSIHRLGSFGKEVILLQQLDQIPAYRLLANMMLRRDEIAYLQAATVTPDMLSTTQLQSCYSLTRILLTDLKFMYEQCNCNHEQVKVMNAALGKLVYLTRLFGQELNKYHAFDINHLDEEKARTMLIKFNMDSQLEYSVSSN